MADLSVFFTFENSVLADLSVISENWYSGAPLYIYSSIYIYFENRLKSKKLLQYIYIFVIMGFGYNGAEGAENFGNLRLQYIYIF